MESSLFGIEEFHLASLLEGFHLLKNFLLLKIGANVCPRPLDDLKKMGLFTDLCLVFIPTHIYTKILNCSVRTELEHIIYRQLA